MPGTPHTRRIPERYEEFLRARDMDPAIAWGLGNIVAAGAGIVALVEDRLLRQYQLTYAGWRLLTTVAINGPTEPRELARLLYLSRPAVVNGLNTLERAKLITRVPDDADRRLVRAVLTDGGQELFDIVTPAIYELQGEVTALVSEEDRDTLVSLAGHLSYALRKLYERTTAERPRGPIARTAAEEREEDAAI